MGRSIVPRKNACGPAKRCRPIQSANDPAEDEASVDKSEAAGATDDILIEKQMMKKRKGKKEGKEASFKVVSAARDSVYGGGPLNEVQKFENTVVSILALLFLLILSEGIFLGASGFLSESADQFATDVVYPLFSPTLGVFLAGSTFYGLWKTRSAPEDSK